MFARPRPKKSILPPLEKKRKVNHAIEEISFDNDARADYLTGFHKRKVQRIKHAQEEAAKKAKEEKILIRKHMREGRKKEVEEHVQLVESILREAERAGGVSDTSDGEAEEWDGIPDAPIDEPVDHEEEYIDEDRYTTVTIESVSVDRDGLHKPAEEISEEEAAERKALEEARQAAAAAKSKPTHPPKQKKPKFRYETKAERLVNRRKLQAKKKQMSSRD
ncbi:nucleolar protein 12-domain-containing protein [Pseudomassariella vexata]|uniref:Nucleolar protein 12-domain-containing protein n=1 Tax=Pseudomassariella vexata TaxID=1141098 RepID=A0A1Y2EKF3_9PEZI|nr:nucleolar protein 12-domain-containing protein [Pseudomassariella vexata]ORY72012.1 nucleolar protein 12-domain-containing protein [Pseudomassariella vexata]